MEIIKILKKEKTSIILLFSLLALFPITYILGNWSINFFLFLISFIYLINIFKNKAFFEFKNSNFLILFFLWITYIINLFFSQNFDLSLNRV